MSAEGVPVAEREAFAAYITSQENIGFDAVVWRGVGGDPLGIVHEPQYSENSLRSEWAAWLARSTHPAAASAESIRAEVIEECAKVCDGIVAARKRHARHGARAGAVTTAVENVAHMIRALSARATKEL